MSDNLPPLPAWLDEFPHEHREWIIPRLQAYAREAASNEADDFQPVVEEVERLQKALAFWMPGVPDANHALHERVAHDAYLLAGYDGPNNEPSAFELGHVSLAAIEANTQAVENVTYADGTTATGPHPLPVRSPNEQLAFQALQNLDAVEAMLGGCTGPTILIRSVLTHHCATPQSQPVAQPVHCQTCNDNGMIGGPSFYAPDEGGVPCPVCSQPDGMRPLDVLTSIWNAMQNSADGDDLLNKLEYMRDSIERAVQGDQQQALQELADDAQMVYGGYTAQPVQAQPSTRMWHDRIKDEHPTSEPEYWPNALKVEYMEREILDLRALVAQPKPANQQKE